MHMITNWRRYLAAATVLAALGVGAAQPAAATTVISDYGYWTSVVDSDGSGQRICGVRTQMRGGGELRLMVIGGKVHLVARHPDWSMRSGETVRVAVAVDGDMFRGDANVLDGQTLVVMGLSRDFLDEFIDGSRMEANFGGVRWSVNLAGTSRATSDMGACLAATRRPEMMS